jgi:hypothetical protein
MLAQVRSVADVLIQGKLYGRLERLSCSVVGQRVHFVHVILEVEVLGFLLFIERGLEGREL